MSTSQEVLQEQSHNWRAIAVRAAAVAGVSIASLSVGNTVHADDGPSDGCGYDLDSAGGWYYTGKSCTGDAPAPAPTPTPEAPRPTQTTQPRQTQPDAPRTTSPSRDSGSEREEDTSSGDGDDSSSESTQSSDDWSRSEQAEDAPVRLSWIEKLIQNCEGQEGDPVTADAIAAAYNHEGLTDWDRGSHRLEALVRYCNRAFLDLNGNGILDAADIDPATGIGVSNFSWIIDDRLILFPPDSSNSITPNLVQRPIESLDDVADWQVLFPPAPEIVPEEAVETETSDATVSSLSGFVAPPIRFSAGGQMAIQ